MNAGEVYLQNQLDVVKEVGLFYLKTTILINGAAIVVMIGLLGSIIDKNNILNNGDLYLFRIALILFVLGIIFSLLSTASTYFSAQTSLSDCKRKIWTIIHRLLFILMFVFGALSLLSFGGGAWSAVNAFSGLGR